MDRILVMLAMSTLHVLTPLSRNQSTEFDYSVSSAFPMVIVTNVLLDPKRANFEDCSGNLDCLLLFWTSRVHRSTYHRFP